MGVIAGVPLNREPEAMSASLLHSIQEIKDNRKTKPRALLPTNPTKIRRGSSPSPDMIGDFKVYPYTATQAEKKKTISLNDGYVRLFGKDTENVKESVGADRPTGKRQYDEPPRGSEKGLPKGKKQYE